MKYYKIILDHTFIGAISSGHFVTESPSNHKLYYSSEIKGQYIDYEGILYRDYWMYPLISDKYEFTNANISEISEEEYNAFIAAKQSEQEIIIDDDDDEPVPSTPVPSEDDIDEMRDYLREAKIAEMSSACRQAIENGIDIIAQGKMRHFSLTTQDQLNLMSLNVMAQTQDIVPYHADGEQCIYYTAEEIKHIVAAANSHKIWHTTYYNALKTYINSLETIEEISAITYGTPIPDEFKTEVLKVIA